MYLFQKEEWLNGLEIPNLPQFKYDYAKMNYPAIHWSYRVKRPWHIIWPMIQKPMQGLA